MRLYLDGAKKIIMRIVNASRGDALQVELHTGAGIRLFALSLPRERDAILLLNDKGDDRKRYAGLQIIDLVNGEPFFTLYLPAKMADAMGELQKQLLGEKPFSEVVIE